MFLQGANRRKCPSTLSILPDNCDLPQGRNGFLGLPWAKRCLTDQGFLAIDKILVGSEDTQLPSFPKVGLILEVGLLFQFVGDLDFFQGVPPPRSWDA